MATTAAAYGYNALGQIKSSTPTAGASYPFSYSYDLQGSLKSIMYPSGRVVSYGLSGAGRVTSAGSYASGVTYAAHGAMSGFTMGNGVRETAIYDARLQPQTITAAKGATTLLSLTNAYAANGNVRSQQITIPSSQYTQAFGYDNLNRLVTAQETNAGAGSPAWAQTYGFDGYGNRAVTGSSFAENLAVPVSLSQYDATTNRIALAPDNSPMPADAYDAAGNLQDHPAMGTFAYDAENRMISATTQGITTQYTYDGEGRRVMTSGPAGTTVFVYGAGGELLAEYGAAAAAAGTRYLTADALGSTRMVTDAVGTVTSRHDYQPFGEELPGSSNASLRTAGNGFVGQETGVPGVYGEGAGWGNRAGLFWGEIL
jgi:YD repeat-containing protein